MPFKCCVPGSRTNYKNGEIHSVFNFPKDIELQQKWLRAICRQDFKPTKSTRVCELHFRESEIERTLTAYDDKTGRQLSAPLTKPRLIAGAVPSQLPNCPKYLSSQQTSARGSPNLRRERLENAALSSAVSESLDSFERYRQAKAFSNFNELKEKVDHNVFSLDWLIVKKVDSVHFLLINYAPNATVKCSVMVNENLLLSVHFHNTLVKSLPGFSLPLQVDNINQIENILQKCHLMFLSSVENTSVDNCIHVIVGYFEQLEQMLPDVATTIIFLKEQVSLLPVYKTRARYSCNTMVFCSLLHSISPHAYKFLRASNNVKVPSPSTIQKLCNSFLSNPQLEQDPSNLLGYLSMKCSLLSPEDKAVILLMDEIHLKPLSDYKGGNIVGNGHETTELANRAYVFMITSLGSSFKEVVHIVPIKAINGETLHKILRKIIMRLEDLTFEVMAVVSDNNKINSSAMSLFSSPPSLKHTYPHPKDAARNLFFIIDTVHVLKCVRNNWINQKPNQEMVYPDFTNENCDEAQVASFSALKELHSSEKVSLLKYGYKLSLKALYPSSIECQNVKLAVQVFSRDICVALKELGPIKHFQNWEMTAKYIEIICTWWDIVNVKTPLKGQRLRNTFQEPITLQSHHVFNFFSQFLKWLERWETLKGKSPLTNETHSALKLSTEAILALSKYWLTNKGKSFLLCGKIQTDNLEAQFGRYRQLAGSQYHVSVRQIFESESKLRIQNLLSLVIKSHRSGDIKVTVSAAKVSKVLKEAMDIGPQEVPQVLLSNCVVDDDDVDDISDVTWPLLTYVAGYISYAIQKKLKCDYCKVFLLEDDVASLDNIGVGIPTSSTSLISACNRGGLCFPHKDIVLCTAYVFIIMQKLVSKEYEHIFLQQLNQRSVLISLADKNKPQNVFIGHHCFSHEAAGLYKDIVHISANILLNNYTKQKNDVTTHKNMPQCKRIKTA